MNNPYAHCFKRKNNSLHHYKQSTQTSNLNTLQSPYNIPKFNHEFLQSRRQNYLSTGYNNRRRRLEEITQKNMKIYLRLENQKSQYSRDIMRKSYQSNALISKRLSQSKISKRSSSSSSMRSSKIIKIKPTKLKNNKKSYKFHAHSVSNVNNQQLQKFSTIFNQNRQNQSPCERLSKPNAKQTQIISKTTVIKDNQHRDNVRLPKIYSRNSSNGHSVKNRSTVKNYSSTQLNMSPKAFQSKPQRLKSQKAQQGAFLHIVMQQMFSKAKK